jgi:hypothetical protein
MNMKTILAAMSGLAVLGGVTLALQFGAVPQANIIANRLEGAWKVDAELTAKLDPAPGAFTPREIKFVKDPNVLNVLGGTYPRYKNFDVFMSGTASMNGQDHWFLVMTENGNNHLVLFAPSRTVPADDPHHVHISMVVSRNTEKDLLFLGGDMARESAVAYGRLLR